MGAKRVGSEDGRIPAWQCGNDGTPPGIKTSAADVEGKHVYPAMANPFSSEKPKLVITSKNYQKYKENLTDGEIALLKRYPDSFRMPVYKSHRTGCFSKEVYKQTALNVKNAKLTNGGNDGHHMYMGLPFPLAETGAEATWNNLVNPNPYYEHAHYKSIAIFGNGRRAEELDDYYSMSFYNDPGIGRKKYVERSKPKQSGFYHITLEPENERGTANIGLTFMHKLSDRRQTWGYKPGTRRVRRSPFFGYDTPQGAGGLRGIDEDRMWNGPFDRFDVKYLGTKKIYVPYNDYAWDQAGSYENLVGKHAVNPKYRRWELHRVRVVEATLKPGKQHWYQKRVIYLDEDSGHALLADNYDHHGDLWRTSQQNYVWTPLCNCMFARGSIYHDLQANAYVVDRMFQEESFKPHLNSERKSEDFFSPSTLRRKSFR